MNTLKNKTKIKFLLIFKAIWILVFCSCNNNIPNDVKRALEISKDNRSELEKVIEYYRDSKDSLKLKAAYFLIGNMQNKYFYPYNNAEKKLINHLNIVFENTEGFSSPKAERLKAYSDSLESEWAAIKENSSNSKSAPLLDLNYVTAEMLIENINMAFKIWEEVPWGNAFSFDDFCKYILPYKNKSDIPDFWRKDLVKQFDWVKDSISINDPFYIYRRIIDTVQVYNCYSKVLEEISNFKIKDAYNIGYSSCIEQASKRIAALRALGVPCARIDALYGTSWGLMPKHLEKKLKKASIRPFSISPQMDSIYKKEIAFKRLSKVFMVTYDLQPDTPSKLSKNDIPDLFKRRDYKDITGEFIQATDIKLKLTIPPLKETNIAYLCEFKKLEWKPSYWGEIKDGKVKFEQMGVNKIYLPTYYSNGNFIPAGNPFYVNEENKITQLRGDGHKKSKAILHRKFPLNIKEYRYACLMRDAVFEGANNKSFKDPVALYTINEKPLYLRKSKTLSNKKFRFVRYRTRNKNKIINTEKGLYISLLSFYNDQTGKLKGKPITSNLAFNKNLENVFDSDIRTNLKEECDDEVWVGLDFGKATTINELEYFYPNSFNTIEPHDRYELLYWDNEWKSLGKKTATKNYLEYLVPENTVFWLKNLTKGKEEMIFFMRNGEQIWG